MNVVCFACFFNFLAAINNYFLLINVSRDTLKAVAILAIV